MRYNFDVRKGPISVECFRGGLTNIAYNCLDRHVVAGRGGDTCFMWEGNDVGREKSMTYEEALEEVCRLVRWARGYVLFTGGISGN